MEGYVYVMSNRAMPGLVKVGFTTNTPEERATQLDGTHSPHLMVVEYWAKAPNIREVERAAHRILRQYHEGKEWFRCSPGQAANAVKRAAGDSLKRERSRADEEAAREKALQAAREQAEAKRQKQADENRKHALRFDVEKKFYPLLQQAGNAPGYFQFWLGAWFVACVGLSVWSRLSDAGILIGGAMLALIPAVVIKEKADDRKRKSAAYILLLKERQLELDAIDASPPPPLQTQDMGDGNRIVVCPYCTQQLRIPNGRRLLVTCKKCRSEFDIGAA